MTTDIDAPPRRTAYPIAILGVLLAANILNFVDRQLPYILAEQIKRDLLLSDTQLGLLGGAAFAVIYAVLAVPLGYLADRYGSRWVLSGCILVWSVATAMGALASNFVQLAATRFGVAIGEAGATPSAYATISAHVPAARRASAISIFSLGVPIGTMLGLILGGWISGVMSWRWAFVILSAPGLVIALLAAIALRPSASVARGCERDTRPSIPATIRLIVAHPVLRHILIAVTVFNMGAYGAIAFTPPFYARQFGLSAAQVGLALGMVHGIAGTAGALVGGIAGDRLGAGDPRWRLWIPAIGPIVAVPFTAGAFLSTTLAASIGCFMIPKLANLLYLGPVFATVNTLVPVRMRATASATMYLGMGLVGMSLGPLAVGMASDALRPRLGEGSLRIALLLVIITQIWAAFHFWTASRHVKRCGPDVA